MTDSEALQLLIDKRKELGTKRVAADLEVSEATIRAITTGNYGGNPDNLLRKAVRQYKETIRCPFIDDEPIPMADCKARSTAPEPFGGETKRRWWLCCQSCPNKE